MTTMTTATTDTTSHAGARLPPGGGNGGDARVSLAPTARADPHPWQKLASSSLARPQAGQVRAIPPSRDGRPVVRASYPLVLQSRQVQRRMPVAPDPTPPVKRPLVLRRSLAGRAQPAGAGFSGASARAHAAAAGEHEGGGGERRHRPVGERRPRPPGAPQHAADGAGGEAWRAPVAVEYRPMAEARSPGRHGAPDQRLAGAFGRGDVEAVGREQHRQRPAGARGGEPEVHGREDHVAGDHHAGTGRRGR